MAEIALVRVVKWCRWCWLPFSGLIFGWIAVPFVNARIHDYVESLRPQTALISSITVHPRDANGSVLMEVRFNSAPAPDCIRFGTHQLSRPPQVPTDGERRFLPMGSTLAGEGYPMLARRDFTLAFHFPSTIVADRYLYTYRTFYQCGPYNAIPFTDWVSREVVIP